MNYFEKIAIKNEKLVKNKKIPKSIIIRNIKTSFIKQSKKKINNKPNIIF